MADIKLLKLGFTKQDLKNLKEEEIIFVLQVGGILQEVATLHKLLLMSTRGVQANVERMAENSQAIYILRLLASTLHEGWKVICHRKYKKLVSDYKNFSDRIAISALRSFQSYFGNEKNLCTKIRNNYSYHYNYGNVANAFQKLPHDDLLEIYLSENHANCRYLASDTVQISAIFDITDVKDFSEKLPTAIDEILSVAKCFMDFTGGFIFLIMSKVREKIANKTEDIIIPNPPNINDLRLHYFVDG